jgi:hypothetical protein
MLAPAPLLGQVSNHTLGLMRLSLFEATLRKASTTLICAGLKSVCCWLWTGVWLHKADISKGTLQCLAHMP